MELKIEKEEAAQERAATRGNCLEKEKIVKRELCVKKKIERREQSVAVFERDI